MYKDRDESAVYARAIRDGTIFHLEREVVHCM